MDFELKGTITHVSYDCGKTAIPQLDANPAQVQEPQPEGDDDDGINPDGQENDGDDDSDDDSDGDSDGGSDEYFQNNGEQTEPQNYQNYEIQGET